MKKLLKYTACLAILLMVLILFPGCCQVTGGGWFYDCEGDKCTFGVNAQGDEGDFKGQFQFKDHGTGVKFHVDEMTLVGTDPINGIGYFEGMDKDEYMVHVALTDWGKPGADPGDGILIVHDEYGTWTGFLEGGNIQIHKED